ncbi:MAG: 1-deoxy-D-xylulose 5-phosphate reductoisomerase [Cyclobacteriaceae bacterium]|nr:MAG: 1-deoxy-D-xylulose 5-phosphate reductoisomerase [Cyclobacteriaceae bacterium]
MIEGLQNRYCRLPSGRTLSHKEIAPSRKNIAILGSTGSIGTQALEVISANSEFFQVEVLTAGSNADLLIEQSIRFRPNAVVISDSSKYQKVMQALNPLDIKVYTDNAIADVVTMDSVDLVLTALVGYTGLLPTINAIKSGKTIALANKETLVVAGQLITSLAEQHGVNIYPVDSEHSAIFQCLMGEWHNPIEKIILTASGGPFLGRDKKFLAQVTRKEALNHPNWDMGAKITIDSATLMNKGLEVIEAKWLFGLSLDQVEVVIHPQSIIHSMVQFTDGSIKAQMGLPDMKLPILFALSYPQRLATDFPRLDFSKFTELTFEQPDLQTFRNLALAFEAMKLGGNMPCVLNAANEVAVAEFLQERIGFMEMSEVVESCLSKMPFIKSPCYEDFVATDKQTRIKAQEIIN